MKFTWKDGNRLQLLENGEAFFPRVFEAISQAEKEVLIETFILFEDKVGQALQRELIAAAERGVRVEVTVDGYGSADLGSEFIAAMTRVGVHIQMFDPKPKTLGMRTNVFRRLHRKLVVVDGKLAFVGGLNFSADHLADYGPEAKQDYALEIVGPVVDDIHRFALATVAPPSPPRHWWQRRIEAVENTEAPHIEGIGNVRALFVTRDNEEHQNDIEEHYLDAIRNARRRLVIANAYFFPGYRLLREIRNAARRGVKVKLILQGQPDMPIAKFGARMLYNYLLRDGVEIYEYCRRPLHGKVALADHEWVTVGSSNLDPLSLSLNLESNLVIRDTEINRQLYEHLEALMASDCKHIALERIVRGYFWRAPLIFLIFHFLRHFPSWVGWLPAHSPTLAQLQPHVDSIDEDDATRLQRGHQ
ncbi:cardiolipin synthase ClsB [Pseudomonas indica]|uniref:Cardiolipin synthase B n=1 Tax=Pseudomonas indica TaxID=137658 RepID=A0A1G9LUT7_9PSED|nr:cardiolipin synthase ClsB [Pseudomonas indica]SDL65716.1 cardiolipin synthase [Pseudomonas indica]